MEVCPICFEKRRWGQFVRTECGCTACSLCHVSWARSQLDSKTQVVLRCPMPQCMAPLTTKDILSTLDEETQEQLEEARTLGLLRASPDVKTCPLCNYAGFVIGRLRSFHCESCGKCWQEPGHTWTSFLRSLWMLRFDILSQVWKRFFCKECPSCYSFIQKNEGCKHMECSKCGYEFCWLCFCEWKGHSEELCSGYLEEPGICIGGVLALLLLIKLLNVFPTLRFVLGFSSFWLVIATLIAVDVYFLWLTSVVSFFKAVGLILGRRGYMPTYEMRRMSEGYDIRWVLIWWVAQVPLQLGVIFIASNFFWVRLMCYTAYLLLAGKLGFDCMVSVQQMLHR